ncbi:MAG: hypothetical protein ABFE07_29395 [Armatimonadia bacterium]
MVTVEEFRGLSPYVRAIVLRHEQAAVASRCTCSGLFQVKSPGVQVHTCPGHERLQQLERINLELSQLGDEPKPEWIG